jgi:molecular chaperone DnaK (HSP70)
VAFTDIERFVGDAAVNQAARNYANTIFGEYQTTGVNLSFSRTVHSVFA